MLTGYSKVPDQLVRIRSSQQVNEIDIDELSSNHGCNVELLILVQCTTQLERLSMTCQDLGKHLVVQRHSGTSMT